MTEAPVKYKNATTKRVRKMTSVQTQETIKQRLNGEPVCHVVYEGEDGEDLKKVREKLKCSANCNLQIRNNKIYEIRKRPKKQEIIRKVMLDTINILADSKLLNTESSADDTFKYVFNKFLNGTDKTVFKLKNNNNT